MSKVITTMIAVAFCFSTVMAQVLIYDYSASFKDLSVKTVKNVKSDVGTKVTIDSAKVASDKFTGYVVIEACEDCSGEMAESTDEDNKALVYVAPKNTKGVVYRTLGTFRANMFGAKSGQAAGVAVGIDKFTDASGILTYTLDWGKISNCGILGFDNYMEDTVEVWNGGYGKVDNRTQTVDLGCFVETTGCYMVNTLAGAFAGTTNYSGFCSEILFDICSYDVDQTVPLPGTFSMKLNNKMTFTKKAFNYLDFAEAEPAILAAMKATAVYAPASDDAVAECDVDPVEYWED